MSAPNACYFYPFTAKCPARNQRAIELTGAPVSSEHALVRGAQPRWREDESWGRQFGRHRQPRIYSLDHDRRCTTLTGWDDSDPYAVKSHLRLMQEAKIDVVIFNTYGGLKQTNEGNLDFSTELSGPRLQFAKSAQEMAFKTFHYCCNVCLSSPRVLLPVPFTPGNDHGKELRKDYQISKESILRVVEDLLKKEMSGPSYYRFNHKPVLFLYDAVKITRMEPSFTPNVLKETVAEIRDLARLILQTNLYIVGLVFKAEDASVAEGAGFDAVSSYILLPEFDSSQVRPIQDYQELVGSTIRSWNNFSSRISIPFMPASVPGWDASPRGTPEVQLEQTKGYYPFSPIVVNSSADVFKAMHMASVDFIEAEVAKKGTSVPFRSVLACWNEMSEGCTVLPEIDLENNAVNSDYIDVLRDCHLAEAV